MRIFRRSTMSILFSLAAILMVVSGFAITGVIRSSLAKAAPATATHAHIDCSNSNQAALCTDVSNSDDVFGRYVGHDEPSNLFYSNVPGSGNRNSWKMTLPSDPTTDNPLTPGKSYNFQLHITFWLGMAMCDTQSDPNQLTVNGPESPVLSSQG